MSEIWKPIPGYEGLYSVNGHGLIRSEQRVEFCPASRGRRKHMRVRPERILKQRPNWRGYPCVMLYDGRGGSKMWSVHRLVARAVFGPSDLTVNHKDFDKNNNRPENLEYLTVKENLAHARANRAWNTPSGERHHMKGILGAKNPMAKLNERQRQEIKNLRHTKTKKAVAAMYGVCARTIQKVWDVPH